MRSSPRKFRVHEEVSNPIRRPRNRRARLADDQPRGSLLAGRLLLPGPGRRALSLAEGPTLRAVVGSVLHLVLIALFSLGIAAAVRDSGTSIGVVLGLLYIVPILSQTISDPHWQRLLQQIAPMSAGLAVQATTDLRSLPISP